MQKPQKNRTKTLPILTAGIALFTVSMMQAANQLLWRFLGHGNKISFLVHIIGFSVYMFLNIYLIKELLANVLNSTAKEMGADKQ